MIDRKEHAERISHLLKRFPVVAILGARQVGKTTLAAQIVRQRSAISTRFDLENPADLARLADPLLALEGLKGIVVLDEVQRRPELFPVLRVLADRRPVRTRFLLLGSASPHLLRQTSETLAGRIAYHELPGLSLREVGGERADRLWVRGGFPLSFLARSDAASLEWRREFTRTFVERDLPMLGINVAADTMRRFWSMVAHHHGQIWNASEMGRSFGVADTTVRSHLDKLTDALVVRQLKPWHENLSKRQVKAPKVYLRDTGLLHALLNLPTQRDIEGHPKLGASWEGFVLDQIVQTVDAQPDETHYWRTHQGAELDLLIVRGRHRHGFEIKRTSAPSITASMRSALADLRLTSLHVVHAGKVSFPLAKHVRALSIDDLTKISI
ncbi:MAG: ATP-binding protein [Ideonella sp.]|nr:ATP-binding protein [Ideonella sp.]MCC7457662.1 ATP-binding protein [Nitrospira sp.]